MAKAWYIDGRLKLNGNNVLFDNDLYNETNPDNHLPFIIHPVSRVTVNDGNGVISETTYDYAGGYYNYGTREYRGFESVKQSNPDGTIVETLFHQDEFLKGRQYQVDSSESDGGALLSHSRMTWDAAFLDPPDDTYAFVKLDQKRTESYDRVTVFTQENYTYNYLNGNLLEAVTSGTDAQSIILTNEYNNYGDWIWRKTKETVVGSESGKAVRQTSYGYDESHDGWSAPPGRGNLTSTTSWCR